jgi:ATP-binding cassette subfamily F protein 3
MTGLLLWKEHLKGFYQKYNQINDEISELENQLNTLMEEWEALQ